VVAEAISIILGRNLTGLYAQPTYHL